MYLTRRDLEKVKSLFSFLLSSTTWIIIESLKLAFSIFDNKFDVYRVADAAVPEADAVFETPDRLIGFYMATGPALLLSVLIIII